MNIKVNVFSRFETVVLAVVSLFCILALFADVQIMSGLRTVSKWSIFLFFILACLGLFFLYILLNKEQVQFNKQKVFYSFSVVVALCSCMLSCHGIGQAFGFIYNDSPFTMTGSFDTPVGLTSSLCVSIPFIWYMMQKSQKTFLRYGSLVVLLLLVICIIASCCRTGIFTLALIGASLVGAKYQKYCFKKCYLLWIIFFVSLLIGLYSFKKDSADGRLLIWKCAWNMFKDKPFMGYGWDGFQANYMNYQADYFIEFPDSFFIRLADNVNYPFNEYLGLMLNYGVVGVLGLMTLVALLYHSYKRHICDETRIAGLSLWSVATFSLFSYPLSYIYVWIILIISSFTIMFFTRSVILILSRTVYKIAILISVIYGLWYVGMNLHAQYIWGKVADASLQEQTEELFAKYEELLPRLKRNKYFLYNYAAELHYANRYKESIRIAILCELLWADYELQLLLGDNYMKVKQYGKAEFHYLKASHMCPARFKPLYKLFKMYKQNDDKENACRLAIEIIRKPIKTDSMQLQYMLSEVTLYLQKNAINAM